MSFSAQYTDDPRECLDPQTGSFGAAALPLTTALDIFRSTVLRCPDSPALCLKRAVNGIIPSKWTVWTFRDYWSDCNAFGKSLVALNVQQHAVINIIGFNSPEWAISNNGAMLIGAIPAGIYASNSVAACEYVSDHSKAEIIVMDGMEQLAKYQQLHSSLSRVKAYVVWGINTLDETTVQSCSPIPVYTWDQFLKIGKNVSDDVMWRRFMSVRPGHCATLIYTSGTTALPKAVMLSHDNISWTCRVFANGYVKKGPNFQGRVVSYLPLSHIAAQMIDIHYGLYSGTATYFAQPDALKGSLVTTLKDVRPTVFFGVPRVYEKIAEKLQESGRGNTGIKQFISNLAKKIGTSHCDMLQFTGGGGTPWGYYFANKLVFSQVKAAIGLDACTEFYTAAAPISIFTLDYFASLDIPVLELFGQSECTGPHTSSKGNEWRIGYCGRPLPGTITRIDPNSNELCYRGRHIFMGYMYMPEQTAAVFDSDGFMKSGDVAEFDENNQGNECGLGFMKITGRIKDLLITAGGENIPPVLIEEHIKKELYPTIANCVVIGDRRKYLTCLIILKTEIDSVTGQLTTNLAEGPRYISAQIGSSSLTSEQASSDPLWAKFIEEGIRRANEKSISSAQIIQKWKLLLKDFTEADGELTPTLKIKRNVINEKYRSEIESMYD